MQQLDFVFSNQRKWRLYRHISFWLCWYLFQVYLYSFTPSPLLDRMSFGNRFLLNMNDAFWYLFPNMFLAYSLMYYVIPKLIIPAKYIRATVTVLLLILVSGALSGLLSITIIEHFRTLFLLQHPGVFSTQIPREGTPIHVILYLALISGLRGCITIAGLAASIKLMKYFYEKQQQALILEQEKTVAELQSLKAQLHPHFLFNTLNNIYSHAQETAPVAADMLLSLSLLLRYMLYYCNAPLVALKQEVDMLLQYIELEKKRYGNQLEIVVQIPDDFENLMIAPLLILPFMENCFKHGTSDVLERPWMNINMTIKDGELHLKLINGKTQNIARQTGGIGISNVRKRLALLYPDQYNLRIIEEEEMYIVNLSLKLTQAEA
jgi:sensor histidine kinase YesM